MIGKKDKNVIYIIDFGLSIKYISSKTNNHIKFTKKGKFAGTLRFGSPNALRGGQQSRKDDLISIGYMIIFFMKKVLPWQLIKARNIKERHILIYKMKIAYSPEKLCNSLPKQMTEYMKYVQGLLFDQNPNYKYLQNLFKSILKDMNKDPNTFLFSWIKQSDIPYLKKYVNPSSRRSSPQQRLLKKIKERSIERQSRESSSNSLGNYSCESATNTINNPNIKILRNDNKDNFGSENNISFKSKNNTNTLVVNFDKIINEKLIDAFDKIDDALNNIISTNMNSKINYNMIINNNINKNNNKEIEKKEYKNPINFEQIKNRIKIEKNRDKKEVTDLIMNIKKNKENYLANNKNNIIKQKNEIKQPKNCIKKENDKLNKSLFPDGEKRNNLQENYSHNKEFNKKNIMNENMFETKEKYNNNYIENLGKNPRKHNFINEEKNERNNNIKKFQNSKLYNENNNINIIKQTEDYLIKQNTDDVIQYSNQNYMNDIIIPKQNINKKNKVLIKNMVNKNNLYFENNNLNVDKFKNCKLNENSNNIKNINNNNFLLQIESSDSNNNLNTQNFQTEPTDKRNKAYILYDNNLNFDKYHNIAHNMDNDNIFSNNSNSYRIINTNENVQSKEIKQKISPQIPLIHKIKKINNNQMIKTENYLEYNNINTKIINNNTKEYNVSKKENNRNPNFKVIKKYRKAPQNGNMTKNNKFIYYGNIQNNILTYLPMDSIQNSEFQNE